jgi:iron complex outermembrane receptor protein
METMLFFAVINVVTKSGASLNGGEVMASAASYGTMPGAPATVKHSPTEPISSVSATLSDSKGQRLYYPEYDTPATNNGFANNADDESLRKLLATVLEGKLLIPGLAARTAKREFPPGPTEHSSTTNRTRSSEQP